MVKNLTVLFPLFLCIILTNVINGEDTPKKGPMVKKLVDTASNGDKYFEKIRIKDLATFEGVRDNQLIGYGLVVGLNGSGDTLSSSPYTKESLISMLERLGVNIRDGKIPSGKNVAAVMVTANLPPFARHGTKIDVSVSALGDAKDLRGGVLLVTPLYGADGEVYAVSQGNVSVSGLTASGTNASITKGVPTAGTIVNGGIVEKEINFDFESLNVINMSLRNPDFTTAERMAFKINTYFNDEIASSKDPSTIVLTIPKQFKKNMVGFLTEVEQLRIRPDQTAKVVIDDTNGVIVVGKDVRISPIAITQGSITVTISEEPIVQSTSNIIGNNNTVVVANNQNNNGHNNKSIDLTGNPSYISLLKLQKSREDSIEGKFSPQKTSILDDKELSEMDKKLKIKELEDKQKAELDVIKKESAEQVQKLQLIQQEKFSHEDGDSDNSKNNVTTDAGITEEKGKFTILNGGTNLEDVVNGLNSLGVTPKEMGSILRAIKAAGALQADIKDT